MFVNAKGLAIASLCLLTGCMTSRREEELQANILRLERKLSDVEKQILVRDRTVDSVRTVTDDSNRRMQAAKNEVEDLRRQLSLTQGAIDELRVKMTRVQEVSGGSNLPESDGSLDAKVAALDEALTNMDRRVTRVELIAAPLIEKQQDGKPAASPKGGSTGPKNAKFKTAGELSRSLGAAYAQKDYKGVITTASNVLLARPGTDQQEVALEFRGTAYFQSQQYEKAAIDFTQFLDRFPKSDRRPRALLFAGDSFVYLKQNRTAKSYYAECVKLFPEREECKAAQERLDKMGS
jgi:TolA-binding protein